MTLRLSLIALFALLLVSGMASLSAQVPEQDVPEQIAVLVR